ncbi:MAG: magnesium chelatase ATPase subunit D, partial [Ectothiorhodospira sp.]
MTESAAPELTPWELASIAAGLFAVDPAGCGGVSLKAHAGPVRDRWLELLRGVLPPAAPMRRLPLHIADGRLLGGLDLTATLKAGRPIAERGLLAECDGGVVVAAMAERLTPATAGRVAAVMDAHEVRLERDGLGMRVPTRFGVVALDEGV